VWSQRVITQRASTPLSLTAMVNYHDHIVKSNLSPRAESKGHNAQGFHAAQPDSFLNYNTQNIVYPTKHK